MLIKKIFETSIDISDPNDIFNIDEQFIKNILKERYVSRCHKGMFILDILRIVRKSNIYLADDRLDGSAYFSVQFEAQGDVLFAGEILHGCKISKIHANAITAIHKYAGVKIRNTSVTNILKTGDVIPVVVKKSMYAVNKPQISVLGIPYVPTQEDQRIVFQITRGMNDEETKKLKVILGYIDEREKKVATYEKKNKSSMQFYNALLYGYKKDQKFATSAEAKKRKILPVKLNSKELLKLTQGVIIYTGLDHPYQKRLFHGKKLITMEDDLVIENDLYSVLSNIFNMYLRYLDALIGFAETYKTKEQILKIKKYLSVCRKMQK